MFTLPSVRLSCCYYPFFCFFFFSAFFFAFLIYPYPYILPLTFTPPQAGNRIQNVEPSNGGGPKKENHRSILLHTYIALDGIGLVWFGLVISKCLVLTLILTDFSLSSFFWYTHTPTHTRSLCICYLYLFVFDVSSTWLVLFCSAVVSIRFTEPSGPSLKR